MFLLNCHIVICIHISLFSCMHALTFLNSGKHFNSLIALDLFRSEYVILGKPCKFLCCELAGRCPMVMSPSNAHALSSLIELTFQYT